MPQLQRQVAEVGQQVFHPVHTEIATQAEPPQHCSQRSRGRDLLQVLVTLWPGLVERLNG